MNKRAYINPYFILIVVGLLLFGGALGLGSLVGYDVVYKQDWGHACCVQHDAYDVDYTRSVSQQSDYKCSEYTNECYIYFRNPLSSSLSSLSGKYTISGRDSVSFRLSSGEERMVTLPYGKTITFGGIWPIGYQVDKVVVTKKAKSFYIKGQEDGAIFTQESCIYNSELKKRILADGLNELTFDQCVNYLIGFKQVATKTYFYNGQEVICQARRLYAVENRQFKDGATRKLQGTQITAVECCPSESNCDEDTFKFVEHNVRECTIDSECPNGGNPVPVSGSSYVTYDCVNEKCVQSAEQYTECTNTAVCIAKHGEGYVCDLSPANWGTCKQSTPRIGYCGDGVCESILGETTISCPDDCGNYTRDSWWSWWYLLLLIPILLIIFGRWLSPILSPVLGGVKALFQGIPFIGPFLVWMTNLVFPTK